jgi:hypothetical protein
MLINPSEILRIAPERDISQRFKCEVQENGAARERF